MPCTPCITPPSRPTFCRKGLPGRGSPIDELLAGQLALALVRAHQRKLPGRGSSGEGLLRAKVIAALPYSLTPSQGRAVDDIVTDLAKPHRMIRLLQGDVGSGKTVVALLAAATVVEAGRQAALMAPTEILVRQHLATIAPLAEKAGIRVAILTGRERGKERAETLERLALGEIDLIVGTHALFQDEVAFRDLALAIVDEQHRFGVHQRLALARKGEAVDMLVLTATPIPRTLVLTYFGDMEISELREKPAGRQPIDTRTIALDRLDEVVDAIGRALDEGKRVYWVCPLVAETEGSDLAAAEERFADLKKRFGAKVDLVHGQMKGADKDAAMARFLGGADAASGRHHGDRGRRRRSRRDRHGDRARRTLRACRNCISCAAASAAAATARFVCCSTVPRLAKPPRPGSPSCATPRTASGLPKKTCACAAKATCSAPARAACRAFAWRGSNSTASCWRQPATMPR